MRPTEQLIEEHTVIKVMLDVLEAVSQQLSAGRDIDTEHLEQMVEFIRLFADRYHHGKEEDLLYPAMEEAGIPRDGGPIGVMLTEHDEGRSYVRGMSDSIAAYKAGDRQAMPGIIDNARAYAYLLAQHIDKENNILYRMADTHISEAKQQELAREFAEVEASKIGAGRADEFRRLVRTLQTTYVK